MRNLLKYVKKIAKVIYFLFPKIIRSQYDDSLHYYLEIIRRLLSLNSKIKHVILVGAPESLNGTEILYIEEDRRASINAPILYKNVNNIRSLKQVSGAEPDIYILKINQCTVIGWSMGVLKGNVLFHSELAQQNFSHDNKRPNIYLYDNQYNGPSNMRIHMNKISKRVKLGIHLLKEHSPNYFHWLFECMPRLIYIMKFIEGNKLKDKKLTFLVDKHIPLQCINMLETYIQGFKIRYEILYLDHTEFAQCDELYYVTPFWYALDNTRHYPNVNKDFLVDSQAVRLVRESLLNKSIVCKPTRKIYLARRNGQMRNIINMDEVELLFDDLGFEIFYTDVMSFDEQCQLFNSAYIVVGAAGAAFSNIIFMQPMAHVVMLSPSQAKTNYYIFQQIADVAEVDLIHFLTTPQKHTNSVHDDFSIDCPELKNLVLNKLGMLADV